MFYISSKFTFQLKEEISELKMKKQTQNLSAVQLESSKKRLKELKFQIEQLKLRNKTVLENVSKVLYMFYFYK